MEPVVAYIGLWKWTWTDEMQWFDVPWGNYIGRVGIISCLAFYQQLAHRFFTRLYGLFAAMLPAYVVVFVWIKGYVWFINQNWFPETIWVSFFLEDVRYSLRNI